MADNWNCIKQFVKRNNQTPADLKALCEEHNYSVFIGETIVKRQ